MTAQDHDVHGEGAWAHDQSLFLLVFPVHKLSKGDVAAGRVLHGCMIS